MTSKNGKKKRGRPTLGALAKTYQRRVKLPQVTGKRLEEQAEVADRGVNELIREDVELGIKRRDRKFGNLSPK